MKILYVVATPIGNLKDITFRALEVLKDVDFILAEDTRNARKILSFYKISKPVYRYDDNVGEKVYRFIKEKFEKEEKCALITDAGTPNICDPGWKLFNYLRKEFDNIIKIIPVPGVSALTCGLSICPFNISQFTFLGYPPRKKREEFFKKIKLIEIRPIVLYESVHRLKKTLNDLKLVYGFEQKIIILKELTKVYEEYFEGNLSEAENYFSGEKLKGEFIVLIP
ncbi:MAG: 16S rRNA (cytidine(1402)-2'-O)-methyltransferase [Candidatus Pacearchaeota archaeon]